jgi:hypothetical protein
MSVYFALLAGAVVPGITTTVRLIKGGTLDGLAVFVMTTMLIGVGIALIAGSPRFLLAKEAWVTAVGGAWFLVSARGRRPLALLFAPPSARGETGVHERVVERPVGAPSPVSTRVAHLKRDLGGRPAR